MATIATREDLSDYCLRQLGAPVLQINVAEEQIDDCIDDAIQKFQEFHGDGSEHTMLEIVVSEADFENHYITLPENVFFIKRIFNTGVGMSMDNLSQKAAMADMMNLGGMGGGGGCPPGSKPNPMVSYVLTQQYLSLLENLFGGEKSFRFTRHANRLYIDTDWREFAVSLQENEDGEMVPMTRMMIECWTMVEPDDYDQAYNNQWLKAYTTELIRRQWGWNLKKYQGFQLPSGITLDGDSIYQEAKEKIEKLEEDLYLIWQLPVDFMVG